MFPVKILVTKLKHFLNARGVLNQLIFSAGIVLLVWFVWNYFHSAMAFVPKYLRRYLQFPEGYTIPEQQFSEVELENLMLKVEKLNLDAEVFNWNKHGNVREETPLIAVQVHRDVERLQFLIISLGQVHFIQQVLLVFSHSYYDERINALIGSIHFCKYMQIFYPYSMQLYPNKFPGAEPDECNSPVRDANESGPCSERDARRTEHKHHWWWKAHFIFDGLELKSDKRVVVFLEEDDYVLPDLLYMMRYARRTLAYFPSAEVMALGRPHATGLDYDVLIVDTWTPLHSRGLAFNVTTWRRITARAAMYCLYDDCNWSSSLANLFGGLVDMAACLAPRVLPTRSLTSGSGWSSARAAQALGARAALFPGAARVAVTVSAAGRVRRAWSAPRGNGGWRDVRDQLQCLEAGVAASTELSTTTVPSPYAPRNVTRSYQ